VLKFLGKGLVKTPEILSAAKAIFLRMEALPIRTKRRFPSGMTNKDGMAKKDGITNKAVPERELF
jgi:hypothetical protein